MSLQQDIPPSGIDPNVTQAVIESLDARITQGSLAS